jgi:uncharacterized SAM-dependent methyltransferase
MHLISRLDQRVRIGDTSVTFSAGETIRTEYSHKYDAASFYEMAQRSGLAKKQAWTDPLNQFVVAYLAAEVA